MAQVAFVPLPERLGRSGPLQAAVVGAVTTPMAAPGSQRASHRWLGEPNGLGGLLDVDFETMRLEALWRAPDFLRKRPAAIEAQRFDRIAELFGLAPTITLYDLTNAYFETEGGQRQGQARALEGEAHRQSLAGPPRRTPATLSIGFSAPRRGWTGPMPSLTRGGAAATCRAVSLK